MPIQRLGNTSLVLHLCLTGVRRLAVWVWAEQANHVFDASLPGSPQSRLQSSFLVLNHATTVCLGTVQIRAAVSLHDIGKDMLRLIEFARARSQKLQGEAFEGKSCDLYRW